MGCFRGISHRHRRILRAVVRNDSIISGDFPKGIVLLNRVKQKCPSNFDRHLFNKIKVLN